MSYYGKDIDKYKEISHSCIMMIIFLMTINKI